MYKPEIKELYFQSLDSQVKQRDAQRIFNMLDELEEETDTDLYDIPFDVILERIIQESNLSSFMTFRARYYTVKDYKKWAFTKGLVSQYAIAYIDENINLKEIFLKWSNINLFKTPKELANNLSRLLYKRAEDQTLISIDEIASAYAMLIYQGYTPEEALQLKVDDVQISNSNIAIVTQDKITVIYPEFQEIIQRVAKYRNYYYRHANMQDILPLNTYLIDNGRNASVQTRRQNMMLIFNMRDLHIKLKDVYYMGKLYDFYQNNPKDSDRSRILEYCFGGDRLTKTRREQFYRFIELWNS